MPRHVRLYLGLLVCLGFGAQNATASLLSSLGDQPDLLQSLDDETDLLATSIPLDASVRIVTEGRLGANYLPDLPKLLRQGDAKALAEKARKLIAKEPSSGLALEVLGAAQFSLGNLVGARAAFQRATELEPEQAGPWAKLGIVSLALGAPDAAEDALNRAIVLDPENRFAHQRLGMLYQARGDARRAITHYRAGLIGTPPDYLGVALNLAELQNRAGAFGATVALLEPRLPLASRTVDAQIALGKAYLETARFDNSRERYQRALDVDTESERAALGLAAALRARGAVEESLAQINVVLKRDPESLYAHLELGGTLLALDRRQDAYAAFERAIEMGADPLLVRKRIAAEHLTRSEFELARAVYTELVEQGIGDEDSFGRLAELQFAAGDAVAARQTLQQGIQRYPDSAALFLRLGSLSASLGSYKESLDDLQKAYQLAPANPKILQTYSLALTRTGDRAAAARVAGELYDTLNGAPAAGLIYTASLRADGQDAEAEKIYRELLAKQPQDALFLNNLADLLQSRDQLDEAEVLARKANQVETDNANLLDTLGWILFRKGRTAEALDVMKRAASLAPEAATIQYHHGVVLQEAGRNSEAKAALDTALKLAPQGPWAGDAETRRSKL